MTASYLGIITARLVSGPCYRHSSITDDLGQREKQIGRLKNVLL